MKGFQLTSGVMLLAIGLFSLQTEFVSAAYSMSETCKYVTSGWIADPSSCQAWGWCKGGKLMGTGKCNDGLLFNAKTGDCNNAAEVTCTSTVKDACQNLQTPQMVADPNDCTRFCYCDGKGGYECNVCPPKQSYNPTTNQCVWSSSYPCPANSICRLVANNVFVGDPDNCGNFIDCYNGGGYSTACENNQYFNPLTGYCQNTNFCSSTGGNTDTPTDAGLGVLRPLPTDAAMCKGVTATEAAPAFVADKKTCFGYYFCTSATGPGTWSKCPLNTHFDGKTCVTPYTYVCPYDRCGNINQPFVTKPNSTCKSYFYCKNQTNIPSGDSNCPKGNPFFDEVLGACVPNKPGFTICGP